MKNWVVFNRKIRYWEWYQDSKMFHLFFHLIISANHTDSNWRGIKIKRGQLITGRQKLSFETGISEQSVRTFLKRLKKTGEILIESTKDFTIITVCKYDTYQFKNGLVNQLTNHQVTNNQPTTNHQLTTNNKGINTVKQESIKREYKQDALDYFDEIIQFFPEKTRPKEVAQRKAWLDTIEKISNDGYSLPELRKIIEHFRKDDFWSGKFLVLPKLLKKNKDGIKYIDFFMENYRPAQKGFKVERSKINEIQKSNNRMMFQ